MAQAGVSDIPYAENHPIDEDEAATTSPFLIYDADSSQHSAIMDVLAGKNLTIFGPPGTGKSQTIANIIAAAAMAGKTILFVAEKLTALEVVWDRLAKAGLGDFCFNLHGQGLRSGEVKRSLEERLTKSRPAFDQSTYERQKERWTEQRDGLRTYASVMGEPIGRLKETVHDILWQAVTHREAETNLPPAIAALELSKVETATASEINKARNSIKILQNANAKVRRIVGGSGQSPWRGLQRSDIAPVEVGSSLHLIDTWEQRLASLEDAARQCGLSGDVVTIERLRSILRANEVLEPFSDVTKYCDLVPLTGEDTRSQISHAADRCRRLQHTGDELIRRFAVDLGQLPETHDLRGVMERASSLGVADLSPSAIRDRAQVLREKAELRDLVDDTLARLGSCLELDSTAEGADETIERAIELLQETPVELLSSRTEALVALDAKGILQRAEAELQKLQQSRAELAARFDLGSLPALEELRLAARTLNAVRGPLLFNKQARRAAGVHKELSLTKGKRSPSEAARDFRDLADYREGSDRLESDAEIASCFGLHWRGIESDLSRAKSVVEWSVAVFDRLPGSEGERSAARRMLLSGETERLVEFREFAGRLPADWRGIWSDLESAEIRQTADRMEAVADRSEAVGLGALLPLSQIAELTDLITAFHSLSDETTADKVLARVFPSQEPDLPMLEKVQALASAMSGADLSDSVWIQAVEFFGHTPDPAQARRALTDEIPPTEGTWSECVDALELDELTFLDGQRHVATPLAVLRDRARDCQGARDTLLPWSGYQRARKVVLEGHAAPVLSALDQHAVPVARLEEAYEWVLYRSLATFVYRRYPKLNELSGWQLSDHRAAFQDLERRLQELERKRIAHELYSRPIDHGVSFGGPAAFTEKALIQNQAARQSKGLGITLRNLYRRAGTALCQLKPCFMMSPTSVAELLPRDAKSFDIVIIDEASQMLPCDALGAIARGKQAVIVGDPKQLPPSTYFQGAGPVPADNEEEGRQPAGAGHGVRSRPVALSLAATPVPSVALPFPAQQPDPVLERTLLRQSPNRVPRGRRRPGKRGNQVPSRFGWALRQRPQRGRSRASCVRRLRIHEKSREPGPEHGNRRHEPTPTRSHP